MIDEFIQRNDPHGRTTEEVIEQDDQQLQESTCGDCLNTFVSEANLDSVQEHGKCIECCVKSFK